MAETRRARRRGPDDICSEPLSSERGTWDATHPRHPGPSQAAGAAAPIANPRTAAPRPRVCVSRAPSRALLSRPGSFGAAGLGSPPRRSHTSEESQMESGLIREPGPSVLVTIAARETRVYLCFDPPRPTASNCPQSVTGRFSCRQGALCLSTASSRFSGVFSSAAPLELDAQ